MKVLIVSANSLAASPTGPAYIAGAALRAGHTVEIFECLFAQDFKSEIKSCIERFQPDVIGVSIRLVHGFLIDESAPYNTRHLDLRETVRQLVNAIGEVTDAKVVLGGPGFNYYARDWLEYLDLDYGIRGEADRSFPLYLERLEQGGELTDIPGSAYWQEGVFHNAERDWVENLDDTAFPAYELLDLERYQQQGISPGILTKRGCAFRCTYCPYRSLEGSPYRLKSPARVVDEIEHIQRIFPAKMIMFCENNFNVPRRHAEAICKEMIARQQTVCWGTGDLRPMGINEDFCRLMKESGCSYLNLSIESASETMLKRMRRGYCVEDVKQSLANLIKAEIPFGVSLLIGAPGETPESVQETFALFDCYAIPLGTWVTIGICLWTSRQEMLADARESGQLTADQSLFDATNYLSPELPRQFMENLIQRLRTDKRYTVQANQPYVGYRWDQGEQVPVVHGS